jgi:integrase
LGEFLTRWLDDCAKPKLRPRSLVSYSQMIRLQITPSLGPIPLQRLTPQQVQSWLNDLSNAGLSPRTCQYARAILRSALGQALRWGVVSRNVSTLVESPRVPRHEIRPLEPDQARALLDAVRLHRLGALFTVALALGLRQGEALGLKWDAVDLKSGALHVREALQWVGNTRQLVEPKSARSRRSVVLPRVAVSGRRHLCNLRHNGARESGHSGAVRRGPPVAKSHSEEHTHDRFQQVRPPGL